MTAASMPARSRATAPGGVGMPSPAANSLNRTLSLSSMTRPFKARSALVLSVCMATALHRRTTLGDSMYGSIFQSPLRPSPLRCLARALSWRMLSTRDQGLARAETRRTGRGRSGKPFTLRV
ncbi:MAG: hypothetical protein WC943_13565 [Elusimicrobiota bacterium]